MTRIFGFNCSIAALTMACLAADRPDAAFAPVTDGVYAIYPISDLTDGHAEQAAEVAKLIRETIGVGRWTTDGGNTAAMRVAPERLTIKADSDVHRDTKRLLSVLRLQRTIALRFDFSVVDCAALPVKEQPSTDSAVDRVNPATPASDRVMAAATRTRFMKDGSPVAVNHATFDGPLPADAKMVVDASQIMTRNGDTATWIDGSGLSLPTVIATATVSGDHKCVTVCLAGDKAANDPAQKLQTIPFGKTAALPLDAARTRWLLFTPTLMDSTVRPVS